MASPQTMTEDQFVPIGVTIQDKAGHTYANISEMPAGSKVTFESSDGSIAQVAVRPDGLNADIGSGAVGTATVTVRATKADGVTDLTGSPDTIEFTVTHGEPGAMVLTVGAPQAETPPPPQEFRTARRS